MKVLHVVASMDPKKGGVSQAVRTMVAGLEPLSIHNEAVCLDAADDQFILEASFPLHALGPAKSFWAYSSRLSPWLLNNFSRFDCIIIHGLWLYPGYAVKKALKQLLKQTAAGLKRGNKQLPKIFVMPHGMLDPYFQKAPGRKIKALRNYIYWKVIEANLINYADNILFTCEEEATLAKQTFRPYRPKKTSVVGLGVNRPPQYSINFKDAFAQKFPKIAGYPYILFLSRIHEKKGLDLLIEAFEKFVFKAQTCNLGNENFLFPKLVIAGPGIETPFGVLIQKKVSDFSVLSANVFFTNMLTGDAKWGAFYGCDAYVLPSHQENFGIAIVEALACGKPVLISNKINIWREVERANSGFIENPTVEGTTKLLESWFSLTDTEKLVMGENAYNLYKNCFSVELAAKQLVKALL